MKFRLLKESKEEHIKDKTGREFSIWTECDGSYSGQSDYLKIAYLGDNWMDENDKIIRDNLLGYLSYSVLDEDDTTAYIKMIEIKKTERRKGIGTKFINSLEKEYKNINWGYTTEEGTKFYQSYHKGED